MNKILKFLLTIIFVSGSIFAIYKLIFNYKDDGLVFTVFSITIFILYLFSRFAPKVFFDLCWKITSIIPDNFDYDRSYRKLNIVGTGMLVVANILLIIGILTLF